MMTTIRTLATLITLATLWLPTASAQNAGGHLAGHHLPAFADNIIVPQSAAFRFSSGPAVEITAVDVGVVILEQAALTTMDISLRNPGGAMQEAEILLPVPAGAVVRSIDFEGEGAEPSARLLPAAEAKSTYESIVATVRDPALLEFAGYNLVRSSVFPVPAGGTQKVRLTYEHLLTASGGRVDYVLPRSESLSYRVPWSIALRAQARTPISTVFSPSHEIETIQPVPHRVSVRLADQAASQPGPFRMSYLLEDDGVSASLFAYPDPASGGGYFLMLASLPTAATQDTAPVKREVTLVLDRSGSMAGEKIDQAQNAALQVLAGLEAGETFNIIVYNDSVSSFAAAPVAKDATTAAQARDYIAAIRASGGTNIHDAMLEALQPEPTEGSLPMVLFLTDGLPTVGVTSEAHIRSAVEAGNSHQRRVFSFGVGYDVNAPLLDQIALQSRGTATYVLPGENVEVKVSSVFRKLAGPVLADVELAVTDAAGRPDHGRLLDTVPGALPDLFEGDQLVLLGRYVGSRPLHCTLSGSYLGQPRQFRFEFGLDEATTRNAFVSRLWASRRIAVLGEEIRQRGAEPTRLASAAIPAAIPRGGSDPHIDELVNEIVRLSTEFGILTEYTAFLAEEGTDLGDRSDVMARARDNFNSRAIGTRSGMGAVNQSFNNMAQMNQTAMNYDNEFIDHNMNRVAITSVQQVNDRAFFRRGDRWVDSRLAQDVGSDTPDRVIKFGTREHLALVEKLVRTGRQGSVSLQGEIVLLVDGESILIER